LVTLTTDQDLDAVSNDAESERAMPSTVRVTLGAVGNDAVLDGAMPSALRTTLDAAIMRILGGLCPCTG
jgi:hypothetical protein